MSARFVAEFESARQIAAAIPAVHDAGGEVAEAFTPFPVPEVMQQLAPISSPVRPVMLVTGLVAAAFVYALQWFSAVVAYPIDSGGRPLHSWPVFLLVPFEIAVLAAGFVGFAAFLWCCGLPRLNTAVFAIPGFERASQDHFFLLAETVDTDGVALRRALSSAGATTVTELWEP